MLKLVLSSVRHNLGRYVATLVAIIAGVGFFTAVSVVSDGVIGSLDGNVDQQYGNVDVAVVPQKADALAGPAAQQDPPKVPLQVAEDLDRLNGVEAGAGVLTAPVSFEGSDGKAFATSATGRLWISDADLNPVSLTEGEAPSGAGEVAVDKGTAEEHDLAVGDDVTVLTAAGAKPATLVGITEFGDSDAVDSGGTVSVDAADAFAWLAGGEEEYDSYYLRASGDPADVVAAGKDVAPDGLTVQTGDQFREDQRDSTGSFAKTLKRGLQAFAVLALLVGGFVIYNTFSVIVAQRLRELAVLAAIGATPRQLKRSLRLEGLVLGVLGSLLGVVAGYLLTLVLEGILRLTGNDLPGTLSFSPTNLVAGVLLGTIITVLSVMSPARRAGRTEPMEALRDAAVEAPTLGRTRAVATGLVAAVGLAAMVAGSGLAVVGMGAVLIVAAVFVGAPYLARAGAFVTRPVLQRFGIEGRLAVDNSVRNPKRTATTANALLIGVFLVTFVAVAGASLRDFLVDQVNDAQSADFLVYSQGGVLDDAFVSDLRAVDDVDEVVTFQRGPITLDGDAAAVSTGDVSAMSDVAALRTSKGSLDDLRDGTIAVVDLEDGKAPSIGDTVKAAGPKGEAVDLEVVALLEATQDSVQVGALVDRTSFTTLVGDAKPTVAFVDLATGAPTSTQDDIENLSERRPDITAMAGNTVGELLRTIMDFLIKAVMGLLLMSVVIALIGIVNTMSLSILERRRELGLLRIIGMTDKRVRRMITAESVLISLLGTVGGLVLGMVVSLLMVFAIDRQSDVGLTPSIPLGQLAVILLAGVVLGVLAALMPARRSTRLEVLDAVAAT